MKKKKTFLIKIKENYIKLNKKLRKIFINNKLNKIKNQKINC